MNWVTAAALRIDSMCLPRCPHTSALLILLHVATETTFHLYQQTVAVVLCLHLCNTHLRLGNLPKHSIVTDQMGEKSSHQNLSKKQIVLNLGPGVPKA